MKRILRLYFFSILSANIHAQTIISTIEKYAEDYGQEKVYLHYDKSTYAPGETIWYKAYLMQGIYPAVSKTLYVDIINDSGRLLSHSMIPVEFSTASAQFDIPAGYAANCIYVKAYTKWMLNFDSAFLYNKSIQVLSKFASIDSVRNEVIPSIHFFAEGGDIIEGVSNKIAFKANDQWGMPVNITGTIKNNTGKEMAKFKAVHDGMGFFYLLPNPGETFMAEWIDENGITHNSKLPVVKETGVCLQLAITGDKRNFIISVAPRLAASLGHIHLLGTINQHKVFELTKDFSTGNISGVIPTSNLPSGILTLTVFDSSWKPLAERITYINNKEYLFAAEMKVVNIGLDKRDKNEMRIIVADSLPATFSVSVTDAGIDDGRSDNIISHLLLTGDLKGNVYNPSYYFSNNADSVAQQLDLVMLTHGWRRFKWDEVVAGKLPAINYAKDTSYFTLSGKLSGISSSELISGEKIIFILHQKDKKNKSVITDIKADGSIEVPSILIYDSTDIFYHLPKIKALKKATIKFNENRIPANNFTEEEIPFFEKTDSSAQGRHLQMAKEHFEIAHPANAKVLETVTIKARPMDALDKRYTTTHFKGGEAYRFNLLTDPMAKGGFNIFIFLMNRVPGLIISQASTNPTVSWHNSFPQLYLDENPVTPDMLTALSVVNIAYIKVFEPPFLFNRSGGGSAIAIYTRQGNDLQLSGPGLPRQTLAGYDSMREFYSPDYSTDSVNNDKSDIRTTLYWNPQVITTSENNQADFTFYNNDISNAFRVVIEGMTGDGRLVHLEKIVER